MVETIVVGLVTFSLLTVVALIAEALEHVFDKASSIRRRKTLGAE